MTFETDSNACGLEASARAGIMLAPILGVRLPWAIALRLKQPSVTRGLALAADVGIDC
jgi:hypothetical protein